MLRQLFITGGSFALGLVCVRFLVTLFTRLGVKQMVRTDGPEAHLKKSKTPTMGGIAFVAAVWITLAAAGALHSPKVKMALIIATASFLIGLVDDLAKYFGKNTKGVGARYKLIIELLLGILLGCFMISQVREPDMIWMPRWFAGLHLGNFLIPFVVFVYIGTINGVNFTDGVDGLAGGVFIPVAAAFGFFILRYEDHSLLPLLAASCGVVMAFLWFNVNPAHIFMGDSGSLFLGGILAAVAILSRAELLLFVAGFVFVAEVMSVILQVASYKLTKKRIFRMAPVHHSYELRGWSENQVSVRFWIASAVCSAIGLALFMA